MHGIESMPTFAEKVQAKAAVTFRDKSADQADEHEALLASYARSKSTNLEDLALARRLYDQKRKLSSLDAQRSHTAAGRIHQQAGDYVRAGRSYEQAGMLGQAAEMYEQAGQDDQVVNLYKQSGNYDRAIELLRNKKKYKQMGDVLEQLAQSFTGSRNTRDAASYQQAGAAYKQAQETGLAKQMYKRAADISAERKEYAYAAGLYDDAGEAELAQQMRDKLAEKKQKKESPKADRTSAPDSYATLDITPQATDTEIKKAYRRLALQHHPDKGGDAEQFKKIINAYEELQKQRDFS